MTVCGSWTVYRLGGWWYDLPAGPSRSKGHVHMIKRVKSDTRDPEPSIGQRNALMDLIRERVEHDNKLLEYDPVVAMALIGTDPEINGRDPLTGEKTALAIRNLPLALAAHKEVAKYTRPQLKQVEVVGAGGGPVEVKTQLTLDIVGLIQGLMTSDGKPDDEAA